MARRRLLVPLFACLAVSAGWAPGAAGATRFRPRIGGAMGLIPPVGSQDIATGALEPAVYHGGAVMTSGVTVHTIFWAPPGYRFSSAPGNGAPGYEDLVKQFFTDVAHDSGTMGNVFSVLPEFGEGTRPGAITPGAYSISYDPASDSIDDSDPYPPAADQCASPDNIATCVTDGQVQAEVDHIVQSTPGTPRGLHNLWYLFLPPDVDECILPGTCGSNAFGGYHSLSDVGHGLTIYALTIDPLIETGGMPPGQDPEGNPDAELTTDIATHETIESMTDPEGVAWMNPDGFEVADMCETAPDRGTPLGFAGPDHAPYNQVINGHDYLVQLMFSNDDNGCVERTGQTSSPLPLPQVNLRQFSSRITGDIGAATGGVGVRVTLQRAGAGGATVTVASGSTRTRTDGSWSLSLRSHVVGDDRDQITVDYSGAAAPTPSRQLILTGNGDNPYDEAGWTGWTDLDNSAFLTNQPALGGPSLTVGPCFQTGVLGGTINGTPFEVSPTDFCNTQTDTATLGTATITRRDALTLSSDDNRAYSPVDGLTPNPTGGLVELTVPLGEPDAISRFVNPLPTFESSGFPTCAADLEAQTVTCTGLVPGERYAVRDSRSRSRLVRNADDDGSIRGRPAAGGIRGGDRLALSNGARTLTTLHVAHLRVEITGRQTLLAGGRCQPGEYFAAPLTTAPTNSAAGGPGVALTGRICPLSGHAAGLSASHIVQTDEFSGGLTRTEVPSIHSTSPVDGETMYGGFTALASATLPGPHNAVVFVDRTSRIELTIVTAGSGRRVFHARNVDSAGGVWVGGLGPGIYRATWTVHDANGDTRTMRTTFLESALLGV